jgi:hypothetical protein
MALKVISAILKHVEYSVVYFSRQKNNYKNRGRIGHSYPFGDRNVPKRCLIRFVTASQ